MFFFSKKPRIVGLEKGVQDFRVCELAFRKKNWVIKALTSQEVSCTLLDKEEVISSVGTHHVLIRQLELPRMSDKELAASLNFQAEPLLPYPLESCLLQHVVNSKGSLGTEVTLFAVKKEHLKAHLEDFASASIEPERVTCVPHALAALSSYFISDFQNFLICHSGEIYTTCVLILEGKLIYSHFLPYSRNSLDELEFELELNKVLLSFRSQAKNHPINTLTLLGFTNQKIPRLKKISGMEVEIPKTRFKNLSDEDLATYAIPIGTALAGATATVDFRQKEFSYGKKWKRLKTPLLTYFILSCILSSLFFAWGRLNLKERLTTLQQEYLTLLSTHEKEYATFEIPFREEEAPVASSLTADEITARLTSLEKEIKAQPNTYPLLPLIPKVRDLLAWLERHPHIANEPSKIKIESLRYQLTHRPTFSKPGEKYRARVSLEFTAINPSVARAFHESLRDPSDFIDSNSEVKWNVSNETYRATFNLKDQTVYR